MNTREDDQHNERVEALAIEFESNEPFYEALRIEVLFTLEKAVREAGLKIHSVITRVKGIEEFLEKVQRKGYSDPFREMVDIVGARVVCLFLSDIDIVGKMVEESFTVVKREDKSAESEPNYWAYQSVHYDCTLRESNSGARYDAIKGFVFEIQVRTMLQDAWANIEHYLAYKGLNSVPEELRRDFSALAGTLHTSDKAFQQLSHSAREVDEEAEKQIDEARHMDDYTAFDIPIDRSSLKAYLRREFPDRAASDDAVYSELVSQLALIDVRTIAQLRDILSQHLDEALRQEAAHPPKSDGGQTIRYLDAGFVRMTVDYASPDFRKRRGFETKVPRFPA